MKKIFLVIIMTLFMSFSVYAEPTVYIDGEIAQEGSGGIIDLTQFVDDITKYSVGFVYNGMWATAKDVVSFVLDNLPSIHLNSSDSLDGGYSVDRQTFADINRLLTVGGYNGYIVVPSRSSSGYPFNKNTNWSSGLSYAYQYSRNGEAYWSMSTFPLGSFVVTGGNLYIRANGTSYYYSEGGYYYGNQNYNGYFTTGSTTANTTFGVTNSSLNASTRTFTVQYLNKDVYFIPDNGNTLGNNAISPQAFTPYTPQQFSSINYGDWFDNKFVDNLNVENNYYYTIEAPEPVEEEPSTVFDPALIYTNINNTLSNYSQNGGSGGSISFDNSGIHFITHVFNALPFSIQNIILMTLTIIVAVAVCGAVGLSANRILNSNAVMNRLHQPIRFRWW